MSPPDFGRQWSLSLRSGSRRISLHARKCLLMRLSEVKKKYRNQWVLVEFSKLDKNLRVKDGKVLAHAASKEDIYKALLHTRGKNVSIEYCGKTPEDLVVMFCLTAAY